MSCNPCCCMNLKDASVSIGIWSTIWSIVQMGIFGWQMAAIKYERDRAANVMLPNYNTYGKYDIPTYYESYWQSPEERYYTGLFVIQILCLIVSFFLLFASVMLIYGIHTWTRCLVWPWIVVMVASMLTSLAYCIMWWAGDVRDYWLLLTIVEFFGVLINFYCFVVVCVFHCQIFELKYYEDQKKYDRFDQIRGTSQHTIEQDFDEIERPQHAELPQRSWEDFGARPIKRTYPIKMEEPIEPYSTMKSSRLQSPPLPSERRSQSAMAAMGPRSLPSVYDTVQDTSKRTRRKRSSSRRHRSTCKCYCNHHNTCYRHPHHHHHEYPSHYKHSRKHSCSSESYSTGTEQDWGAGRHKKPKPLPKYNSEGTDDSNRRRKLVGKGNYINVPARVEHPTSKHMDERLKRPAETKTALIQTDKQEPEHFLTEPAGISIPHHIFIPPPAARDGQDSQAERKYQINSEITISYDPYEQRMQRIDGQQQPLPPPKQRPKKKEVTSFASNV